ncbi:MAG: restriction endonuclease subunit S [Anaerolineales bacterium]|nr:restriction endonuclease subunit S [Anaerolineales bacterium]
MGSEWKTTTIGEQVTLQRGIDITKVQQRPGKIPVVSSGGISSYHDTAYAKAPGVVLGRKGTIGTVFYIQDDYWPHDTSLWVRDFHGNNPRFVYYFFKSISQDLASLDVGTANPALNRNHVHPIAVQWPELSDQHAIARILGALDDKIELNRRMNRTLEEMAQAIFKSWFVDFDPVVARSQGRQPYGMSAETAELFPTVLHSEEEGIIPDGWRIGTVHEVFDLTMGQSPPGKTYNEAGDGIAFYQGRTDFGLRYPTPRVYCTAPTRYANTGDTLISVRAPVGDINMALEKCSIGRGLATIRHKLGHRSYTYYSMRFLRSEFDVFEGEGTLFGSISGEGFRNIKIIIPPPEVINEFENRSYPIDQSIENNERQSATLASIRDALLPKLLSGQLRVRNVDQYIEQSL